jgi:hypothetical protein
VLWGLCILAGVVVVVVVVVIIIMLPIKPGGGGGGGEGFASWSMGLQLSCAFCILLNSGECCLGRLDVGTSILVKLTKKILQKYKC